MPVPEGYKLSALRKRDRLKEMGFGVAPTEPESPIWSYMLGLHDPKNDPRLTTEEKLNNEYSTMADYLDANPDKAGWGDLAKWDYAGKVGGALADIPKALIEALKRPIENPLTSESTSNPVRDIVNQVGTDIKGLFSDAPEYLYENPRVPADLLLMALGGEVTKGVRGAAAERAATARQATAESATRIVPDETLLLPEKITDRVFTETSPSWDALIPEEKLLPRGSYEMPAPRSALEQLKTDMLRGEGPFADVLSDVDKILPGKSAMGVLDDALTEGIPPELLRDVERMGLLPGKKGGTKAIGKKATPKVGAEITTGPDPRSFKIEKVQVAPGQNVYEKLVKDFGSGEANIGGTRATLVKRGNGYGIELTQKGVTHSVPGTITGNVKSEAAKRLMEILGL